MNIRQNQIPEVTDPSRQKVWSILRSYAGLASIHVTMADIYGNAIMLGTEWNRYELSRAAKKVVLQADFIVDTDCMRQYPNLVRIPAEVVDAVVYWPMGVWPQCSVGVYDSDEEHMNLMNKALKTPEDTEAYVKQYVLSYNSREEYLAMIGKEKIEKLCTNPTTHLMDPYRKWIKSDAEIKELEGR
jgi:glutaconate CoA-transferase subunit A